MSKLDEERKNKKEIGEQVEILEELGQDSEEKGSKIALELYKKEYKENEENDILTVEKLESARNKKIDSLYYEKILEECNLRMSEYRLPMGFRWIAKVSVKGLAIYIESPDGQQYGGGVKVTGEPFTDAKGTIGLVRQALLDVELIQQQWKIQLSTKTKN